MLSVAIAASALASGAAGAQECTLPPPLPPSACPSRAPAPDFVFYDPPCDYVAGRHPETETATERLLWPLPDGAVVIDEEAGMGQCHARVTVRHVRGRRLHAAPGAIDLARTSCAELTRVAAAHEGSAFTVGSAGGMRDDGSVLGAERVARIAASASAHIAVDVQVRRSEDLALLAPIADRVESLRVRSSRSGAALDLGRLPRFPCLRALAVEAGAIRGLASLTSAPGLEALELAGAIDVTEADAIAHIASLRELRYRPRGVVPRDALAHVTQIVRLHIPPRSRLLRAFSGAQLTRLVLDGVVHGPAGEATLRALSTQPGLRTLDLTVDEDVVARVRVALRPLSALETLVLAWRDLPPPLPPLPALAMFVGEGSVDEALVSWLAAQPRLRTVHVVVSDEVLAPRLPRARVYSTARGGHGEDIDEEISSP